MLLILKTQIIGNKSISIYSGMTISSIKINWMEWIRRTVNWAFHQHSKIKVQQTNSKLKSSKKKNLRHRGYISSRSTCLLTQIASCTRLSDICSLCVYMPGRLAICKPTFTLRWFMEWHVCTYFIVITPDCWNQMKSESTIK